MVVIPINVCVPDDIYQDIISGKIQIQGLAKDTSHKIRRHLPIIENSAKKGVQKIAKIIKTHKTESIVIGSILAVALSFTANALHRSRKRKNEALINFGECLETYYQSIKKGVLDRAVIEDLINSINVLEKLNLSISLEPAVLLSVFISIHDYTLKLSSVNNQGDIPSTPIHNITNISIIDVKSLLEIQQKIILET